MDAILFVIEVEGRERATRNWCVMLGDTVVAHHESLGAALAACVYQAEVELRHHPEAMFAKVSLPLPGGGRTTIFCTPSRDWLPILGFGSCQGDVAARPAASATM